MTTQSAKTVDREMMIIFVYDSQMLQKEEDDPSTAILYFHPTWVSDQQKTALCGQLMGTVHCVKSIFSVPKIVSLQSGKFFVKEYGRYLMAVGTDRNIADWLLKHRANTMSSLISFFHQDIEMMSKLYDNNAKLSAKLYQLFETYLKYLFLGGNIFSYCPSIKLPKSASNVFLEAIQILQCCQEINYVMGGTLLYHNKVVATQLSSDITKRIVLTDPYRIKCPAEVPTVNFELPLGVQLLQVYISSKEYFKLHEEATKGRNIFQYLTKPVISAMKRDQSIIFTAVPEEDSDHSLVIKTEKPSGSQNRPKFLNLKNKTTDVDVKKPVSNTPFYGQTSVCSTPMTDLSKVLHSKPMSICINLTKDAKIEEQSDKNLTPVVNCTKNLDNIDKTVPYLKVTSNLYDRKKYSSMYDVREKMKCINKSITMKYYNMELTEKYNISIDKTPDEVKVFKTIADPNYPIFRPDGTVISHPFYKDYLTNQMELITTEIKDEEIQEKSLFEDFDSNLGDFVKSVAPVKKVPDKVVENIEISTLPPKKSNLEHRKSLTLPLKSLSIDGTEQTTSPIRRHSSGVLLTPLMSKLSSFDERSSGFCSRDTTPSEFRMFTPTQQPSFPFGFKKPKKFLYENEDSLHKCVLFVCGQQDMVVTLLLQDEACSSLELITKLWEICTENLGKLEKQLHHCLETYPGGGVQNDSELYSYLYLDPDWDTIHRGGPWGSAELGALTFFHRDFQETTNLVEILMSVKMRTLRWLKVLNLVTSTIFILYTIANIVATTLILQKKLTRIDQIIWGYQIIFMMPFFPYVFGVLFETRELLAPFLIVTIYSAVVNICLSIAVFHVDFGPFNSTELVMAYSFCAVLSVLCCDGVIYGYQCGKSEVFYHQAANGNAGLPTPADPMSNVPLKAKRRLERDHSIILL
ncbi:uncharacterized protein BDFB_002659 [Asbolus verrucosus]|uniref:CCZ1/INTU/HSP4 first Longin domain-containing protein n=1 Tax=Asbolus verrucosus TaxID=1661398 RepID=A0A482WE34_ASBVE|nr:uncharacterized protein BDFB_002659 [Asbolus verrucosus]